MMMVRFRSFIAERVYHNRPRKARRRGQDPDRKLELRHKIKSIIQSEKENLQQQLKDAESPCYNQADSRLAQEENIKLERKAGR